MSVASELQYVEAAQSFSAGFDMSDCLRNDMLLSRSYNTSSFGQPKGEPNHANVAETVARQAKKTGTTICGVVCADGVVIAADTRATQGNVVADKNCEKLHKITDNIWCAGAGVSGDLTHVTKHLGINLELLKMQSNRLPRVQTFVARATQHLWKYQGHVVCALVLAGVDCTGPRLYTISPDGNAMSQPFTSMGSGSLFAMAMLESGYRDDLTIAEGIELVTRAISAGITNDMGSGGYVDVMALTTASPEKPRLLRNYAAPCRNEFPPVPSFNFPVGTTTVLERSDKAVDTRPIGHA